MVKQIENNSWHVFFLIGKQKAVIKILLQANEQKILLLILVIFLSLFIFFGLNFRFRNCSNRSNSKSK